MLLADGNRLGLVNEIDGAIRVVGRIDPKEYDSIESLSKKLGGKIIIEAPDEAIGEQEAGEINGYPIKHTSHFNEITDPIPSYTRTEKSNLRYAAGYYALRFPQGWTHSYCPKLSTLAEYEYIGPFKTKLEMQHQISTKNKEIRI